MSSIVSSYHKCTPNTPPHPSARSDESPCGTNVLAQLDPGCKYVFSAATRTGLDYEHTTEYHFSDTVVVRKQVKCRLLRLWYVCLPRVVPQLHSPRLRQRPQRSSIGTRPSSAVPRRSGSYALVCCGARAALLPRRQHTPAAHGSITDRTTAMCGGRLCAGRGTRRSRPARSPASTSRTSYRQRSGAVRSDCEGRGPACRSAYERRSWRKGRMRGGLLRILVAMGRGDGSDRKQNVYGTPRRLPIAKQHPHLVV